MKIRLCFKLEKEAKFAEDENGIPCETYVCASLKDIKTYDLAEEDYKIAHEGMKKVIAKQIDCDIELITPITLNEYLDNTEDEDD